MKTKLFIYLFGIVLLQGCALQTGTLNPKPALNMSEQNKTLALLLGDSIPNEFLIPAYSGIKKSKVTHWHQSLNNGFRNGFQDYFRPVKAGAKPEYTLKLEKTELALTPSTLGGYNTTTVLNASLKFRASLLDAEGKTLRRISGIAKPDKPIRRIGEGNEAIKEAIENMYVLIARKFFK